MTSIYTQLNDGWNAEPNAPDARVALSGDALLLGFRLNPFRFPEYANGQRATLRFAGCTRYRLGPPNDEAWYGGAHGFAAEPPPWGEFYELHEEPPRTAPATDWVAGPAEGRDVATPPRHFLFYLRDETFECEAADWQLDVHPAPSAR